LQVFALVIGEVFVGVSSGIRSFLGGCDEGFTGEFAAVCNNDITALGLVALRGEVFDLSDEVLAVDDFAEDYVLPIKVGGWDGGDEELGAICT
jgi:hypothetical protein